jgi:hypothetical protein
VAKFLSSDEVTPKSFKERLVSGAFIKSKIWLALLSREEEKGSLNNSMVEAPDP